MMQSQQCSEHKANTSERGGANTWELPARIEQGLHLRTNRQKSKQGQTPEKGGTQFESAERQPKRTDSQVSEDRNGVR